jgi:hypothetical protein
VDFGNTTLYEKPTSLQSTQALPWGVVTIATLTLDKKNKPEIRIDERKAMRQQWLNESDSVHDSFLRQYKR